MRRPTFRALILSGALVSACGHRAESTNPMAGDAGTPVTLAPRGKVLEAAENERPSASASARAAAPPAVAGARVDVPAGKLSAGSPPGDKGRDPPLEPALLEVELGGFSID